MIRVVARHKDSGEYLVSLNPDASASRELGVVVDQVRGAVSPQTLIASIVTRDPDWDWCERDDQGLLKELEDVTGVDFDRLQVLEVEK